MRLLLYESLLDVFSGSGSGGGGNGSILRLCRLFAKLRTNEPSTWLAHSVYVCTTPSTNTIGHFFCLFVFFFFSSFHFSPLLDYKRARELCILFRATLFRFLCFVRKVYSQHITCTEGSTTLLMLQEIIDNQ